VTLSTTLDAAVTAIIIALTTEAARTSDTSVYFEATQRYIAEGCHLHIDMNSNENNL
jgi:hypothetical protein